ncbi:tetratricopeptide repeat protein [Dyella sp.]|uniref:tetratricopeptide repeat protein n=1 Tax=Dyella sp. TaxID=1869338 RepID=UPI003F8118BC
MLMSFMRPYLVAAAIVLMCAISASLYWPGLHGGFLFDDYPNIVDNKGVQPADATFGSLVRASLSSPSSDLKRPISSLSFALNYLAAGLDPFWMKVTNLVIHLVNGLLVFWLTSMLLASPKLRVSQQRATTLSLFIMFAWLILPINLTAVLYVVQRMESLANVFVLLGLIGYLVGRQLDGWRGLAISTASLVSCTAIGVLAKETAVMLPLYALIIEWILFGFRDPHFANFESSKSPLDRRIVVLFVLVLAVPMTMGLAWLAPSFLNHAAWATRDFTLGTRLLSEARVLVDYILWTYAPTPHALSFYHDDFDVSQSLLAPWTTLPCLLILVMLSAAMVTLRHCQPLLALGLGFYLSCHLLTGTVLPLELVYEHRNYFASYGLLLALFPFLIADPGASLPLARWTMLVGLTLLWCGMTWTTAAAWGNPLRLSEELAARAPDSPRAQYELGRTYIIYSHYDRNSPFTQKAYAPLERAATLRDSSILPEQALIFMNARMHLPLKDAWWQSMIEKLQSRKTTVQDESALGALITCARDGGCDLPSDKMRVAIAAALSHPNPNGRLLSEAGDYTLNVLNDAPEAVAYFKRAVTATPGEPVYKVTLIKLLIAMGQFDEAREELSHITPQQKLMLPPGTMEYLAGCLANDRTYVCPQRHIDG